MNKPLLLSLVASTTIFGTNVSAQTMYDRFETMEAKMAQMQKELEQLRAEKTSKVQTANTEEEDDDDDDADEKETTASADDENDSDDEDAKDEFDVIGAFEDMEESISAINIATSGNHLKFGVDYRFAIDNLDYKMANGDEHKNDAFITNRFWLNMDWAATHQISFHGQIAYNKAFGERAGNNPIEYPFEGFDWITNENAYDDKLRIKNAYFLYKNSTFFDTNIPWTFSIGRRPSTNGHLINLRDDDQAASPQGHSINVEFDGLSAMFNLAKVTGVDGMYIKFCAGRGMSNASAKMDSGGAPYADDESNVANIDLAGFIFRPYSNGQYTIDTQYYFANNLIDTNATGNGFETVGNMQSVTASFMANGIGSGWSDFLDETTFFVSGAMSITDPDKGEYMLGSDKSKTGYSYWVGTQFPSLITDDGRWGVEYNHGTKYWRSITYAEDTNIGSKVAARGDAYEAYFTEYLVEDILSMQIRYTYIDYKYSGSNGFFGGNPMTGAGTGFAMLLTDTMPNADKIVDKAQDIRFYLRYKF